MKITVVISYHKALKNLKLILKALNSQSNKDFEVIISEDDFNEETITFIENNKRLFSFNIIHIYEQEKKGFRKNMMLNGAILSSKTDYLVFIDGDCIPHRHFVKEYIENFQEGYFFIGRAVLLSEALTRIVHKKVDFKGLGLLSVYFSKSRRKKNALYFPYFPLSAKTRGLVGRNWGIHKKHLIEINGFDNNFIYAGVGEDFDIEWRLLANGIKKKSVKNKAIVYHLYHEKVYSEDKVQENFKMSYKNKELGYVKCLNGIEQVLITKNIVHLEDC